MIFITGDTHGDFRRFSRKSLFRHMYDLNEKDYVIICGDFGLLWAKDGELRYNLDWLSKLPFTLLWVQGNHENYDMILEYELEEWHGGKARHIVQDKIILLERGQVFNIDGNSFFTFGGASSHDIQGGILDRSAVDFKQKKKLAAISKKPYRIINESWWKQELPNEQELAEAITNLKRVNYKVDYVISHCASNTTQDLIREYALETTPYESDVLTDWFEALEEVLDYKHWYCGHYHLNYNIDDKHTVLYNAIIKLE